MKQYKPVSVSKAAFAFCRLSLAVLIWGAFLFRSESVLVAAFVIFVLSAILKIRTAPMIVLYGWTIGKLIRSEDEVVNEHAMRFAHIIGAVFTAVCILLTTFVGGNAGWYAVLVFALLKSVSAFGFCPASRLYECATGGSCCAFAKKL
jgi:hypothetical protein